MSIPKAEILLRALKREKSARKETEKMLQKKSEELFIKNQSLIKVINEKNVLLESIFKTVVDPYILMDLYGNVLKMNNAAEDFFGYQLNKGQFNISKAILEEDMSQVMDSYATLLEKGTSKGFKIRLQQKDKQIRWVEVNSSLVYDDDHKPLFAHGAIRDITEELKTRQEREELLHHLTVSNQELKDFAHVVSHDLKAPLRGMNALVTWLHEDLKQVVTDKDILLNFDLLIKKIDKMDHLINGILKYTGVDKVKRAQVKVDLNSVLQDVIENIHVPEHVNILIPNKLPYILGDKFRLHQLFQNLVSNAVKYANPEEGVVKIQYNTHKDFYEFTIQDNGIGIDEKYHKKIFEVFQTLDDHHNSTGIGLAIVKKIVTLYKGEVWVTSKPKEHTTFHVKLPIQ
ncbi:sensor histidine kinase [Tenacibaculum agarivorans]|uniref:sensor histidine kinase n=1 Tax=Tenacibaculum agarivorans TaxID=1908389 RepID=UPI00094BB865|nr:ATP-binding protein [Tenacibaculum agarivorans]